jgi:pyruvate/2-oxoglutarate dehydrogenase complex dihydrolipoamide acyltransferase (E2) component
VLKNLVLIRKKRMSAFRKIALGTWSTVGDPSVYGTIELRMDRALEYLAVFNAKTGRRATVTHLVAKAAAAALRAAPDANAILRFNRLYLRQDVGVFFQVAMTDGRPESADLSGLVIHDVDKKSLVELCDEFRERVDLVRVGKDRALEKTRQSMKRIPGIFLRWSLRFVSFIAYTLNLNPALLGVPRDAFGSIMITNIGSLGLDLAYPPLVPYSRVPILLAIGAVRDAPVAEDGQVVVGKVMNLSVTFDHRFIDGVHAAEMANVLRAWIHHPFEHYDPFAPPTPASESAD